MIIDSHTHVFSQWPYGPVNDPVEHGGSARLLASMNANGIDRALLIAAIFGQEGRDSSAFSIQCEHEHPDRFIALPNIDSMGSPTYQTAGAASRLTELHERHGGIRGFVHYCRDYEWFSQTEGRAFFARAADLNHVISLAVFSPGLAPLAQVAREFPSLTFLVHHLGRLQEKNEAEPALAALDAVAEERNVWFKLSGYHHLSADPAGYPYPSLQALIRLLYNTVGPRRLVWGSDSPVVDRYVTYQQSLDVFTEHTPYIPAPEKAQILGGNLAVLLKLNSS